MHLQSMKSFKEKYRNGAFYLSFENMNFYKYRQDQRLHNKGH